MLWALAFQGFGEQISARMTQDSYKIPFNLIWEMKSHNAEETNRCVSICAVATCRLVLRKSLNL